MIGALRRVSAVAAWDGIVYKILKEKAIARDLSLFLSCQKRLHVGINAHDSVTETEVELQNPGYL